MEEELKKLYILEIINEAIKELNNKTKDLKMRLTDVKFEQAIEAFKKPVVPRLMATIEVQNTKTKCSNSFRYFENFFDAAVPNWIDKAAGIEDVKDGQKKLVLRLAYAL